MEGSPGASVEGSSGAYYGGYGLCFRCGWYCRCWLLQLLVWSSYLKVYVKLYIPYTSVSHIPENKTLTSMHIRGSFKKYPNWFFCAETSEAREMCCGMEVDGTFISIRGFFPASRRRQSRVDSVWVRVYRQHSSHFNCLRKWRNGLKQHYCIKFCKKLGDSQVETIRKIQRVSGEDAMGITQIKVWYNGFKDGCSSVDSDLLSGRLSKAEMMSSLTECGLWSRRTVVSPSENLRKRWG